MRLHSRTPKFSLCDSKWSLPPCPARGRALLWQPRGVYFGRDAADPSSKAGGTGTLCPPEQSEEGEEEDLQ